MKAVADAIPETTDRPKAGGLLAIFHRHPLALLMVATFLNGAALVLLGQWAGTPEAAELWARVMPGRGGGMGGGELSPRTGPWGNLQLSRVEIAVPEEFILVTPETTAPRWVFPGENVESVYAFLQSIGFTDEQLRSIPGSRWRVFPEQLVIEPPAEVVLGLSPEVRGRLYRRLARSFENPNQRMPMYFRPPAWKNIMEATEIRSATKRLVRSLAYSNGDNHLIADGSFLMAQVLDSEERARLAKLISRRETFLVNLRVDEKTDLQQVAAYWSRGGLRKDVYPLLDSLARVPGGAGIDITHFLPPFARQRLYTYPFPNLAGDFLKQDCHWTSMNFFNDVPDERFTVPTYTKSVVESEYEIISDAPQFGDMLVMFTEDSEIVHSAIYIADDIVFTKNGGMAVHPWMFMKLDSMVERYSSVYLETGRLPYRFLRRAGR
jgi:hypothetical protein